MLQGLRDRVIMGCPACAGCTSWAFETLNSPVQRTQRPLTWVCTVICPHINVNVLPLLCTCCIIIGFIVCKAVVKGRSCICRRVLSGLVWGNDRDWWVFAECHLDMYSETIQQHSTGFFTNRHSEEVSRPFGAMVGDSWCLGSCTAAGWLGKGLSSANPGGAFASAQLSPHPAPPHSASALP